MLIRSGHEWIAAGNESLARNGTGTDSASLMMRSSWLVTLCDPAYALRLFGDVRISALAGFGLVASRGYSSATNSSQSPP
jgi:hypothetical protein